jgi:hypothetical protein
VIERIRPALPFAGIMAVALAGVFLALNVLGSALPAAPGESSSPSYVAQATPTPPPTPTVVPSPTPSSVASPTIALPSWPPTITTKTAGGSNGIWSVSFQYPQLVSGTTLWARLINTSIEQEIQGRIQAFKVGPAAVRQEPGKVNTLIGTYTIELVTPALLSFVVTWVDDTVSVVRSVETVNFDLGTGQQLGLPDLFADVPAALSIISMESKTLLQPVLGSYYDAAVVELGTTTAASNFANWSLTPTGMAIVFAEYQVADGAAGTPRIVIPWSDLKIVMQTTGPVAYMVGV